MSLESKIKRQVVYFYKREGGRVNRKKLGRAIDWRLKIIKQLSTQVKRLIIGFDEFDGMAGCLCLIRRQIEDELDQYQQAIQDISTRLDDGDIDQDEYEDRLELLTAAIFFIAYLNGSEGDGGELLDASLDVLNSQGNDQAANSIVTDQAIIEQYITDEEARNELDSELAIAAVAGGELAIALASGAYSEAQDSLFSRLTLWAITALGIYGLGQLFNPNDPFYEWLYGATDHCADCNRLNGQRHRASEWRASGWRPQSRSLACKGYRCQCGLYRSSGPASGSF